MKSLLKLHIEFDCELPELATKEQIQEWLAFELAGMAMSVSNPLADSELRQAKVSNIEWKAF